MCANYVPVTSADRLREFFGVAYPNGRPDTDVFPMGGMPFIRLAPSGSDPNTLVRFADDGIFRFVPEFVSKLEWARKTYNARSERVNTAPTYSKAWADGQRCIIPAEAIYEPNYESGKHERWRISLPDSQPMGIAGIYTSWVNAQGEVVFGIAMLTVNADDHPFMRRFHKPGEEKRMVVILDPADFDGWLTCPVKEAKDRYCRQWQGPLVGEHAPKASQAQKTAASDAEATEATEVDTPDDLFSANDNGAGPPPLRRRARSKPMKPPAPPTDPRTDSTGDLFG